MLDEQHFLELIARQLIRQRRNAFADHDAGKRALRLLRDLLRRSQRLEADLVPLRFALFGDERRIFKFVRLRYSTRASCFNFSISFAAISFGWPVMNSVFFVFCGT